MLADGATNLPGVKLTGLVIGALLMFYAIRRLFGGGRKGRGKGKR